MQITRATRTWPGFSIGSGPRGSIALLRAARAYAFIDGRDFVVPDDIKAIALSALRHRVILSPEMEIESITEDELLNEILNKVEDPAHETHRVNPVVYRCVVCHRPGHAVVYSGTLVLGSGGWIVIHRHRF